MHRRGTSIWLTSPALLWLGVVMACPPAVLAKPAAGVLAASVSSVDFGEVPVGSELRRSLSIRNFGTVPLAFTAQVTGPFLLSPPLDEVLPPGATKVITVVFQPVFPGPAAGLLRIVGTVPGGGGGGLVTDIPLSGVGIVPRPALVVSPAALEFNQVDVGAERRRTLLVKNAGNGTLTIRSLSVPPGPFFLATPFSGPLAPGESRSLGVVFRPAEPGPAAATLTIASDDPAAPLVVVHLAGTGVALPVTSPRLVVSPEAIDLGELKIGASAAAAITLRNAGTAPLAVTALAVRGPGWSAGLPPTPFQLAPAAAVEVPLRFQAGSPGSAPGELQVLTNDPDHPDLRVPLRAVIASPPVVPSGFAVEVSPRTVRVLPGSPAPVVYILRALGGQPVRVRCGDAVIELPSGRRLTLSTRPCQRDLPAGGDPVEIQDAVVLPEEVLTPGVREVRFLRTFTSDARSEEHQAVVQLLPSGSLAADFAITTVTVDFPVDGTAVRVRSLLRARALVAGIGTGSALGVWRVDGVPFETFTVDLVGGRPAVLETALPLPTVLAGLHELDLEIRRPAALRTAAVRYLVTEEDVERLRWTLPPGFRAYLKGGGPPEWSWTPKPGARGYEIRIDAGLAAGEVIRTRLPGCELTPELLGRLAPGEHRIEVRALFTSPDVPEPGRPLDGDRLTGTFAVLDRPSPLALGVVDGAGGKSLAWSGPPGEGVFALVAVEPVTRTLLLRRLTTRSELPLGSLYPGTSPGSLAWHVEAYNDLGEKVGESAPVAVAKGEKP
ncbi:MAG TPA: choice-of-anchor D domain-containing protein [Thermoanaerobaculia bacterium]|nr:choice-of-anchor D domain-containing protein [Thermoanaerobaculia bacterium]